VATHLHQSVSAPGAYEALRELEGSSVTAFEPGSLRSILASCGVDDPEATIHDFLAANLLHRYGERIGITTLGIRTALLLEAVNGGDLKDIYRRLCRLDSSLHAYELVREGMTTAFLQSLNERPGFGRLYVCSPWISFERRHEETLVHAVLQAQRRRGTNPEILVITRPEVGTDFVAPPAVRVFQDLGATVFLNRRLHTKLYIREPDTSGGYGMAIVGSQNLTRSTYIELGIRINSDSQMIAQLIAYFWELTNYSHEV